jgi:adenine-specific DNA-methyltransferase
MSKSNAQAMRPYSQHQAKLFATQLSLRQPANSIDKLSHAIASARVDLNPHQVDAALFAVRSPLSKGVILADEVGLGKTIEAGIVISQKWAERKRKLLIIAPATLRKQWQQELMDKFNIPSTILENASYKQLKKEGTLLSGTSLLICSYNFAAAKADVLEDVEWDLVVVDEAHRLRNVYKVGNKMASAIAGVLADVPKLLLTATPLQNSLLELYGLVSIIDPHVFGDITSFKEQYVRGVNENLRNSRLKERIKPFCQRTLRKQVLEYIKFTQRVAMTEEFVPSDDEHRLYEQVSAYLQREKLNALPRSQRTLMTLVLRKLLASSSYAIAATLQKLVERLEHTQARQSVLELLDGEIEGLDELTEEIGADAVEEASDKLSPEELQDLRLELAELRDYAKLASGIRDNAKGAALQKVLATAFEKLQGIGAAKKAVIFTESTRTQRYLADLLSRSGFENEICMMNGSNTDPQSKAIYAEWVKKHAGSDKLSGSKTADMKAAIVEHFRDTATILIATESAAEGVNLQFCSLVVNFDLPWNPQRVEQRIGRCHRYGQKFDVVVVNFLNKRNAADQRVYQLLAEKFKLFDGVFGASDEVLGVIENGVDIEKRIAGVYQTCRTADEIQQAFDEIQQELDEQIKAALETTRLNLLENFDEEVNARLKVSHDQTKAILSKRSSLLLMLAKTELNDVAEFEDGEAVFALHRSPTNSGAAVGTYNFDWRAADSKDQHFFAETSPLASWVVSSALGRDLDSSVTLELDYNAYPFKVSALEPYIGKSGWVAAEKITVSSVEDEDFLAITAITDSGEVLDAELAERLMAIHCSTVFTSQSQIPTAQLDKAIAKQRDAVARQLDERNAVYFDEETGKLDSWADDLKFGLETEIKQLDKDIKEAKKAASVSMSLASKLEHQKKLRDLEQSRNAKRRSLYEAQDSIDEQRDTLIKKVEKQLQCTVNNTKLFAVRWSLR